MMFEDDWEVYILIYEYVILMSDIRRRKMERYKGSYLSYMLMYLFFFLSLALFSGLISVYLLDKGYDASQVSFVVSCSFVASVILQPLIGKLNDCYSLKWVNGIVLFCSAILGILFIKANHIYSISILYSLALGLFNATKPAIERIATLSRHQYGRIRIWGTIGYAIGSQISGIIYEYIAPSAMYLFYSIGLVFCIIGMIGVQNQCLSQKKKTTYPKQKLWNKRFIVYIIIVCLFYGITNLNTTYLPAMFQARGISIDKVSTIILLITLSELPFVYYAHRYMNKISNHTMLIFIFALLIIQFGTYSFIPYSFIQIIVAVCTKAVSTVIFIMLNMKIIASIVNENMQMSALAWVSTFNSFASIIVQQIGGTIIDRTSFTVLYMILFICALFGFVVCFLYKLPSGKEYQLF